MLRRMLFMLGAVVVVVAILAALKFNSIYQQIQQFQAPKPAIDVEAEVARRMDWQSRLPAIGTLKASQGIDLSVEIAGTITDVQFQSGEKVSKGQAIVLLDSEMEQASLVSAEADLSLARLEFQRARSLLDRQAISRSEYDRLNAQSQKAEASVAQLRASLAKKRILAPFSGTIGIRQVDVGDYIAAGTPIATLQDLSTLYVDFFLAEQHVPLLALGQKVQLRVAAYPDERFEGVISALNPKVETTTRNVQVRAELANPDGRLLPGMFADLQVLLPTENAQVVVPETAITYTLYGNSVLLVTEGTPPEGVSRDEPYLVVERRFVTTGERRDGLVVVLDGLEGGEQVITAGQLKLDSGTHVAIAENRTLKLDGAEPASE
ncbi:efflux RND transporter periplasmic adaptor subunit [Stutzerimonas stutzeri]|jgi:membrane fusion protein (multidrug efflux system)|uniref:Efflux RND transporter periplasmic adaptor subunit n=3 Tax=Gammaproteobacteria TaxID=1236 RepID=A0A4S2B9D7_STUST|nr:efflux RND transporter periplasmic adaptor subunit [Stutzerimonas stutzeri]MPS57985.1 efflux RND transporter periplasmic adaptor subunit [Pseudomonas sp.]NMY66347.1 efflux RND transporter periplasmic adaptor subunit [Pseudomonas sp. WS 5018]ABP80780.1 probable RND efflux membrane fusion protein precursor [Stutzerimonas stutzeri A1501]AEA85176.1 RND efflux membrane fusion protein precursor [Stutzerimonas stutzeri DSM 4166]AVX14247.1 efflux RND transporter periplasmic adaptor subunit [Stutzer